MILSTVMMSYPETEKYLIQLRPYSFFSVIKYLPIFMANIAFRALSWSVLFRFFGFFYSVIIMLMQGWVLALLGILTAKFLHPELVEEEDFRNLLGEMALWHSLTVPCLKNTPASRYLRKFSFYAGLIGNTVLLLTLLLVCNLRVKVQFPSRPYVVDEDVEDKLSWQEYEVVKNIATLNIFVSAVIGLGLVSVLLDKIYSWVAMPVFNVFQKSETSRGTTGGHPKTPSTSTQFRSPETPPEQPETPSNHSERTEASPSKPFLRPANPSLRPVIQPNQILRPTTPSRQFMRPVTPSSHSTRTEIPSNFSLRTQATSSNLIIRTEVSSKTFLRPGAPSNYMMRTETSTSNLLIRTEATPSKQILRPVIPSNQEVRSAMLRKAIFKQ